MVNHPQRSRTFNITTRRPWFIEIDGGVLTWPKLTFPFEMVGPGTDAGQRCTRNAVRAAIKACWSYFRHDDTASFAPTARLLGPSGSFIENIEIDGFRHPSELDR